MKTKCFEYRPWLSFDLRVLVGNSPNFFPPPFSGFEPLDIRINNQVL
jgi:hypothetical protein